MGLVAFSCFLMFITCSLKAHAYIETLDVWNARMAGVSAIFFLFLATVLPFV